MPAEELFEAKNEGDAIENAFAEVEKAKGEKTPSESSTETKQAVKEPSSEGKTNTLTEEEPPREASRWRLMRKKNSELSKQLSELQERLSSIEPKISQAQSTTEPLPQWWANQYGNMPESQQAYRQYQENTKAERERIKAEILQEIQGSQQVDVKSQAEAEDYINISIEEMKADGLEFETNELMKFIVDYDKQYSRILDSQGNYDLRKYLELKQKLQPPQDNSGIETKKRIAGDTMRSKVSIPPSGIPQVSLKTLRGSWRDANLQ